MTSRSGVLDSLLGRLRCYKDPRRIRTDVITALGDFPSLVPMSGTLNRPGKPPTQLMYLGGTVKIWFQGAAYNMPVCVWVPEAYPKEAPACYVNPAENMIIKPNHKHVDATGKLYMPYTASWNYRSSTLTGALKAMCSIMAQDPPLRSVKPGQRAAPKPPPGYSAADMAQDDEDPVETVKRSLKKSLSEKLSQSFTRFNQETSQEIDKLLEEQAKLGGGPAQQMTALNTEMSQLEDTLRTLSAKNKEITEWLAANENKKDINIDEMLKPRDTLSRQFLELSAEIETQNDLFYFLDKALARDSIDVDSFIKHVRRIGREQFLSKALLRKVSEKQREQMAAGSDSVPRPMLRGTSSWFKS